MNLLPNIIRYFHGCYQADVRSVHLLDFFGHKVSDQLILEYAELLEGKRIQIPVDTEWADGTEKKLQIYAREKRLYAAAFLVMGKITKGGQPSRMAAPLLLYEAELFREEGAYFLGLAPETGTLNPAILDVLSHKEESADYDTLLRKLPSGYITADKCQALRETLDDYFEDLDTSALEQYPDLWNEAAIRQTAPEGFTILPTLGIGLIEQSIGSRGILTELEKLAEASRYSALLQQAFGPKKRQQIRKNPVSLHLPVTLSEAQQRILQAADQYAFNVVIGPPGSGKSFTTAALAIHYFNQGKSVLIASKNDQAVDVIADKLERDFQLPGIAMRAGRRDYRNALRTRLQDLLYGIGVERVDGKLNREELRDINKLRQRIRKLDREFNKKENEALIRGRKLFELTDTFRGRLRRKRLSKQVEKQKPLWELFRVLRGQIQLEKQIILRLLKHRFQARLYRALRSHRDHLQALVKSLGARNSTQQENYLQQIDFSKLLKALPIWMVNATDISRVLPLDCERFDLVIIDEATQCDIASSLPLLQRAKRAIIFGDPKQLRHISFLSTEQQELLRQRHELPESMGEQLNYRERSLLDLLSEEMKDQEQVHFLNEHFRSLPPIIGFSNHNYYQERLKIMTEIPNYHTQGVQKLIQVDGKLKEEGFNGEEVEAVLNKLREIITSQSNRYPARCSSVGVLSPYREQVNKLQLAIDWEFSVEALERHRLRVGAPHAFQGEERDIMLISLAVDGDTSPATLQYLNRLDVFNVSITRARVEQYVYVSIHPGDLRSDTWLARYLYYLTEELPQKKETPEQSRNAFVEEVVQGLQNIGLRDIYTHYPLGGIEIDVLVVNGQQATAIDLVGYPGRTEDLLTMDRWEMLDRMGLRSFVLPYDQWFFHRNATLDSLQQFVLNLEDEEG